MSRGLVCLNCTLPICDELSSGCLYTAGQDVRKKARVAKARDKFTEAAKLKSAIAALGFKKYDRRRKPDTPQRQLWRIYKQRKKNDAQTPIST